jgi:serine/threonine protein kinase
VVSDPQPDRVLGSLLDGRYQVSKLLGKGGMGNVYLAEDTRLQRRCALKVLHPGLTADRTHVERFLREARTIAQLEHPNIVDIYSYGEEPSGVVWFAMELLLGEDLDARVRARVARPFTTHECCAWGIQIARAMAVVHDAGLIHRDLKTSNIFLAQRRNDEEIIKLLDFGIARPEEGSELTETGVALGTPNYMSPEQVRNKTVDRRSDVYSFGVLLFKLLTNRLPFSGEPIQVAMAHCTEPAPVPSVIAPAAGISPELDALVLRTMAKAPSERHQSMRELEDALGAILHAEAPELAPAIKPPRKGTASQVRLRPDIEPRPATLVTTSKPLVTSSSDNATQPTAAQATGSTIALPAPLRARSDKWLYLTTGISLLSVVLVLGISMVITRDRPSQGTAPSPESAAPAPVSAPPPAPVVPSKTTTEPGDEPIRSPGSVSAPVTVPGEHPETREPSTNPPQHEDIIPLEPLPPTELPRENAAKVKSSIVERPKAKIPTAPVDPFKQIERKAHACRRTHDAVGGAIVTIDYAVSVNGKVTRSIPSVNNELGKCLASVVEGTRFEPKLMLRQELKL